MARRIARRRFLVGTGAACGAAVASPSVAASPRASVLETSIISHLPHRYHGWPTLTQRSNGELLLVCSGGREAHVCPFGRVEMMRSRDEGRTWTWPEVVLDGPIDDRDAGILETAQGTLLATTFTSLAYQANLASASDNNWSQAKLARWNGAHRRISAEERQAALGVWMVRSIDNGLTWSRRYDSLVNSPHGPIQLSDGRLLYAGKQLYRGAKRIGVCESTDDGVSWQWLAGIPTRSGDDHADYHELHAVEAMDGSLVVHVRNHNQRNARETLQARSTDGGRTWSTPRSIDVWGLPSQLLRLRDGRLIMSYGHRRPPFGIQARVSEDHGRSWSAALMLASDGTSGDLGYPSTVELGGHVLLTVWYERLQDSPFAQLRQARWRIA